MSSDDERLRLLEALEMLKADLQRRLEEKIAKGQAIRVKLGTVVCEHAPDGFIEQREADELAKLRQSGEGRQVLFEYDTEDAHGHPIDPIAIIETGVPRAEKTWRDEPPITDIEAKEIKPGHVDDGYEFLGGNPNFESSWKKL
jgi:hypothetical protein